MADWVDLVKQNNEASSPTTQANLDLLKAQTTGANLTNQGTAMSLDFRRQLAAGMTGQSDVSSNPTVPSGGQSPDDFSLNESGVRQHLFQQYSPIPDVWTPQEQQMRTQAGLSGLPGAVDAVKAQHDARIQAANGLRSKAAQSEYNGLYGVVTAPEGRALDALSVVNPAAADRFQAADMSDDQVRQHAAHLAGLTHSVAQLPVEYRKDGVAIDKNTQQEVPGYDQAVGLSAENRADLFKAAQNVVDVPNSDGSTSKVPQWKADGAASLESWVSHAGQIAQIHGSTPAATVAGVSTPRAPVARAAPTAPIPGSPAVASKDPIFNDPDYKLATPQVKQGTSATPAQLEEQKGIATARTSLLQDSSDNSKAAGQALRYYGLAKDIVNSGNATNGWAADKITAVKGALSQFGINPSWLGDPGKTQELVKALTNAGLQNLKTTYGAKVTQSEVFLNLQHANPNAEMQPDALKQLINDQVDNLGYDVNSARRATKYVMSGNDPRQFSTWEQQYFPRQSVARDGKTQPVTGTAPAAAPKAMPSGAKLQQYASTHFGGDTAKAQAFLGAQGYK